MTIIWYMVPETWSATERIFLSSWAIFYLFTLATARKISQKIKKTTGDIILHKCTKNHDHRLYCSWDMARDRCNCYFSFWASFCPLTPLTAQKIKSFKEKRPGENHFTHRHQTIWSYNVWFLRYGARWKDERMEGRKK